MEGELDDEGGFPLLEAENGIVAGVKQEDEPMGVSVDAVLLQVGECGPYQQRHYVHLTYAW